MYDVESIPKQQIIGGTVIPQSITDRLKDEKLRLEDRLQQLNEAIKALDDNPDVARTVNAISKLGHF